jgi:signal transduction histidine kinase
MKRWRIRLRGLPLRLKVAITVVGGALALLGASTYFSFRYWKGEALVIAEQQALLAGGSVRGSVEGALASDQPSQARRVLRQLVERGFIDRARVYSVDGRVLVSSDPAEEGNRARRQWLPPRELVGRDGMARFDPSTETVEAFFPLGRPDASYLQVSFPVGPVRAAMDRGLRVGVALIIVSLVGITVLLFTMLEREVVAPVRRVSGLLDLHAGRGRQSDEIRSLTDSVVKLLERGKAAERLAEEQRAQMAAQAGLAEVGELAAEMAHEFKRPLTSIRTALDLIGQEYALDTRGETMLHTVQEQLEKLSETMRDLFAIAKPIEFRGEALDLATILDGAMMLLAPHPAMRGVQVIREYDGRGTICGDAQRIEQVVLNFLLNAAEAMPEGGTLTVRLRTRAGRVQLEFADTGVGIPAEEVEKVFLPFYSTKPTGTGLGLSLAARIISAHQGSVRIESEPGKGTTIRMELPAAVADPEDIEPGSSWLTHAS